jgi:hypothetical protein
LKLGALFLEIEVRFAPSERMTMISYVFSAFVAFEMVIWSGQVKIFERTANAVELKWAAVFKDMGIASKRSIFQRGFDQHL